MEDTTDNQRSRALVKKVSSETELNCEWIEFLGPDKVAIEFKYHEVTFDDLDKLSKFFGTNKINIGSETRETGYCETCRGTETLTIITIMDITKGLV